MCAYVCTIAAWIKICNGISLYYHETVEEGRRYRYGRDWYDGVWIIASFVLLFLSSLFYNKVSSYLIMIFFIVLPLYRLMDILQKNAHIVLFSQERIYNIFRTHRAVDLGKLLSAERRIVLALLNYIEISILFACIYIHSSFAGNIHLSLYNAIYFSIVTLTTLGFGDIQPIGISKAFAAFESLIGILFIILVMSYLVTLLQKPEKLKDK